MRGTMQKRNSKTVWSWILILGSVLLWQTACAPNSAEEETVVATYRDGEITAREYASWRSHQRRRGDSGPERELDDFATLAMTKVLAARAAERADEPPLVWELAAGERKQLVAALRRELSRTIEVPAAQIDAMLAERDAAREKPPKVRLRNLFKQVPVGASAEERRRIRERVEELRSQLVDGADFATLAAEESDSQTRYRGGRMGMVEPGNLLPEIERAAFALRPGELSEVLETERGFTVLLCEGVKEAWTMPVEEARQRIEQHLSRELGEERWRERRQQLLAAANPVYEPAVVRDSESPPEAVVARWGDHQMTLAELRWAAGRLRLGPLDGLDDHRAAALLEQQVFQAVAAEDARSRDLDAGADFANRLHWKRLEALAGDEVRRWVAAELQHPTDEEVRAFYDENRERFFAVDRFLLSVIRWDPEPSALPEKVLVAEKLVAELRAGTEDFARTAQKTSEHPSAGDGGALAWRARSELAAFGPSVFQAISSLEVGEITGPIRQDGQIWIVWLRDYEPRRAMSFEQAREQARKGLTRERMEALRNQLAGRLRDELAVERVGSTRP